MSRVLTHYTTPNVPACRDMIAEKIFYNMPTLAYWKQKKTRHDNDGLIEGNEFFIPNYLK